MLKWVFHRGDGSQKEGLIGLKKKKMKDDLHGKLPKEM
jgi:hypothetical protein